MSRPLSLLLGPELVLAVFSALLFLFCARHNSGEGRDLALMERLVWLLPFIVTALAFATLLLPDSKNWLWLARATTATCLATLVCGYRLINGFGSGAKGQDAAFILLLVVSAVAVGLALAVSGAMILAATRPAFAAWFSQHKVLGSLLTLLAAVPLGILLGLGVSITVGVLGGFYSAFKR